MAARKPSATLRAILEAYAEGKRQEFIAKQLGIHPTTVGNRLKKAGLSESTLLKRLRDGQSVDSIMEGVRGSDPRLPLDVVAENALLKEQVKALELTLMRMRVDVKSTIRVLSESLELEPAGISAEG